MNLGMHGACPVVLGIVRCERIRPVVAGHPDMCCRHASILACDLSGVSRRDASEYGKERYIRQQAYDGVRLSFDIHGWTPYVEWGAGPRVEPVKGGPKIKDHRETGSG